MYPPHPKTDNPVPAAWRTESARPLSLQNRFLRLAEGETQPASALRFALWLTLTYAALVFLGLWHHACNNDEMQAWMIARDSRSPGELFHNYRYESHPALWYLCLYLLSRFTRDPLAMQGLHGLIAVAALFLVARFAPFSRFHRGVYAFGFYPIFVYALNSRNYTLGLLFLFAFCACYDANPQRLGRLGMLLFLMVNTNAFALAIGIALTLMILLCQGRESLAHPGHRAGMLLFMTLALSGILLSAWQIKPPKDFYTLRPQSSARKLPAHVDQERAARVPAHFARATLPLIQPGASSAEPFALALGGAFLLLLGWVACQSPPGRIALLAGNIPLGIFCYLIEYDGMWRHTGHFFMLLLASLWLTGAHFLRHTPTTAQARTLASGSRVLALLLILQAAAGVGAWVTDVRQPMSAGKAVAEYLRSRHLENLPMIACRDVQTCTVSGYLDRPLYYPESGRQGTFIIWPLRTRFPKGEAALREARLFAQKQSGDSLWIVSENLPEITVPPDVALLGRFENARRKPERYRVYRLSRASGQEPRSREAGFRPGEPRVLRSVKTDPVHLETIPTARKP